MPSTSGRQQRFFGMVKAGEIAKPKGMSDQAVTDFASTPRRGLPESAASAKPKFMADGGGGSGHWMERAFANAGKKGHSLHDTLGISRDKPIPTYRVRKAAASSNPKERKQAQLALNARR